MNDIQPMFRLVVKFQDHLNLPYHDAAEINHYFSKNNWLPFRQLLDNYPGLLIDKLFSTLKPARIVELTDNAKRISKGYPTPDFLSYYTVNCPYKIYSNDIIEILRCHAEVELAYVESGPSIPPSSTEVFNQPLVHQGYLKSSPEGIDAAFAWGVKGGDGRGRVKFVDIEQGWNPESDSTRVGTFPSTGLNYTVFKDHGEAVLNIILKQHGAAGGIGIAPKTNGYIISQWRPDGNFNTADAIFAAISELEFGDIILLEAQVIEPPNMQKLWPVEIQPAIFATIRLATSLGITVIEAGGNGQNSFGEGNDLDEYINDQGQKSFDPKSFDFRESGAILVAAGSDSVPHKRIRHSNFGSRMDCYAWGEMVSTRGSHLGPSDVALDSYRKKIGSTSGAAAIIAGTAIVVQSITERNYDFRLSPKQMREILSDDLLGAPSANGRSVDRIGSMPDLKKIIEYIHLNHLRLKISDNEFHESVVKSNTFSPASG